MCVAEHVVLMAVVLLVALFCFQRFGTSKVSFSFSPIMFLWFSTNVAIGIYNIAKYEPSILKALSPHYIVVFFQRNGKTGWTLLGAIFLCITGMVSLSPPGLSLSSTQLNSALITSKFVEQALKLCLLISDTSAREQFR